MALIDPRLDFIDLKFRENLQAAKDYYTYDYNKIQNRQRIYYINSLKYFDVLAQMYRGYKLETLAKKHKVTEFTIRTQCMKTQRKIEMYLKLRDLGRL
ncbi:MAG: hypothetical protein GY861_17770 [bacterium]|nr:hypothetical protein [bacterium]